MRRYVVGFLFLVVLVNVAGTVMAVDRLLEMPTAGLIHGDVLVRGEIIPGSHRNIEGVFALADRVQLGVVGNYLDKDDELETAGSLKLLLFDEKDGFPSVSIGAREKDFYFIMSKNLGHDIRAHLGIGNGEFDGLFLGFNKLINPVAVQTSSSTGVPLPINLMAEYANRQVNLGVRVYLREAIAVDAGLMDFEKVKLGMNYSF
ncbi:hypothetical protein [Halocella sp. SP3-1]|uniref:hypothetical protein n=1 Tax=Halocella sp. SP3-1 TaxID=2382161 RepID=UPI000F763208|nr:hypothetical protein [Halocella sp. SP3-1]AZO93965.1 hypothetical protein D7D81_04820 [Halocella sp. SP3-1]